MNALPLFQHFVHPKRLSGPIIEAPLSGVSIGEVCDVRRHWREQEVIAKAQVIGFRHDVAILSLLGNPKGLSRESVIVPTGGNFTVEINDKVLGAVLDSNGTIIERLSAQQPHRNPTRRLAVDAAPPAFTDRAPITDIFASGIRVIDGLITCGIGQRIGVFAAAGSGKTTLMTMLMAHANADVFVIGLIGERGREVTEFVEELKHSDHRNRSVVIYATSDASSIDRCNAALLATTVAEYYRDAGCQVVLIQDSMTRYARALRDLALASGELPARRGYPASVFEALPRLLERPGVTKTGSITAFYTVLIESEEEADPIAEEIRSILDGHIILSRKLAAKNHYPAIDALHSLSRVAAQICSPEHLQLASNIRDKLSRLEELQLILDLGEYRPGENTATDKLLAEKDALIHWCCQARNERATTINHLKDMYVIAR